MYKTLFEMDLQKLYVLTNITSFRSTSRQDEFLLHLSISGLDLVIQTCRIPKKKECGTRVGYLAEITPPLCRRYDGQNITVDNFKRPHP